MMKVIQNSFTGGEISPAMYGRIDDQTGYQVGLAKCENFVVLPQGPVQNRAGFEFVRATKYPDKKCALIPFIYNTDQTMVLEFGEKYIRFHTIGATLLNSDGTPYEVVTPYLAEDVADIHYVQSADVVTLVHPSYAPRELQRYSAADWRLTEIDFGKPLDAPTGLSGTYACSAKTDVVTEAMRSMYTIKYVVTAVKDAKVGANVEESPQSSAVSVTGNLFVDASKVSLSWNQVDGAQRYRVYKTYSGRYGFIGETEGTTFVDTNVDPDESVTPPRYIDPFYQQSGIQSVKVTNGGSGYGTKMAVVGVEDTVSIHDWYEDKKGNVQHWYRTASIPAQWAVSTYQCIDDYYTKDDMGQLGPSKVTFDISASGGGTGARARFTFKTPEASGLGEIFKGPYYYVSTDCWSWLVNVELLSEGTGYSSGASFTFTPPSSVFGKYSCTVKAMLAKAKPNVYVTDPTGYGALLEAELDDSGAISGIRVLSPGQGYTNPTIVIDGSQSGGSGATATVSVGLSGDYPGAVTYFQQRRVFAGSYSRPQFVWMTCPGTESDMHNTLPAQDDNCLAVRASVAETSRIRHVVPLSNLMLLTASSEIRTTTSNDDTITPTSIGFAPQTYYGAAAPQPLLVGRAAVFASQRGGHLRSLGYSYQKGGYDSDDLSIRAAHLFENKTVVSMALAKTPQPVIWCVTSDGELLGCTYLADQNVIAWHRHTTKNGTFEAVACVAEDNEDIVYCVVRRTINGSVVRYLERMHERQFSSLENCFFVDAGAEYKGDYTTTISGLTHLEGQEVAILADGKVMPNQTVTDGKITLTNEARHVIIGLPITANLETLPVIMQDKDGGMGRGKMKNVCNVFVRVYQSSGILMGPSEDTMREYSHREREGYGTPPNVISREVSVLVSPEWSDGGQMFIRQKYPLPLTICAISGEVAT